MHEINMSCIMRKPTFCMCENKGADQLGSNCEADLCLCLWYTDSTIPLLLKSKISSLAISCYCFVTVQASLCQTCLETTLLVFSCRGSYGIDNLLIDLLLFVTSTVCDIFLKSRRDNSYIFMYLVKGRIMSHDEN